MWYCPSMCDRALIQNPFIWDEIVDSSVPGKKLGLRTFHCRECGKEMNQVFFNKRLVPYIINKVAAVGEIV